MSAIRENIEPVLGNNIEPVEMQRAPARDAEQAPVPEAVSTAAQEIPKPKSTFTRVAGSGAKAGLNVATAPLGLLIGSCRDLGTIKSASNDVKKAIHSCKKDVDSLCEKLSKQGKTSGNSDYHQAASDLRALYDTAESALRSGNPGYALSLDNLVRDFSAKIDFVPHGNDTIDKFKVKVDATKASAQKVDSLLYKENGNKVDKIELYGSAILGALTLPALPLTMAVGLGFFGLMSVIDGAQAALTNKERMIPGGKAQAPQQFVERGRIDSP